MAGAVRITAKERRVIHHQEAEPGHFCMEQRRTRSGAPSSIALGPCRGSREVEFPFCAMNADLPPDPAPTRELTIRGLPGTSERRLPLRFGARSGDRTGHIMIPVKMVTFELGGESCTIPDTRSPRNPARAPQLPDRRGHGHTPHHDEKPFRYQALRRP